MNVSRMLLNQLSRIRLIFSFIFTSALVVACSGTSPDKETVALEGYSEVDALHIVDCLLPGKVKRVGGITYVSDRRGIRTTASSCQLRGGEYVVYDRADYRSALNVWLPLAEKGDAEAQTYVGEIFEKGLGREVDYSMAALWYEKAANQDFKRAQINLGFLYEKGYGVEKNFGKALNYYRASANGEKLVLASEAREELAKAEQDLQAKINTAKQESRFLRNQLEQINREVPEVSPTQGNSIEEPNEQLAVVQKLYEKSQGEIDSLNQKLDSLTQVAYRSIAPQELIQPVNIKNTDPLEYDDISFGRYFALIIGNQDYQYFDDLESPHKDAKRMQEVLESRYGFSTIMLLDANEKEILNAFNDLYLKIKPEDNLLIFYAGHGNLSEGFHSKRKRGYWLPSNAEPDRLSNWISNSVISDHLDRIRARSILVISDSCYAGNLASEKSSFLMGGLNKNLSKQSIENGISRRSRIVISSGGEKPVLDGAKGEHSIFANALLNLLENNDTILRENVLFSRVSVDVYQQAKLNDIEQSPEMRPIREAGHEGGDFYFIPVVSPRLSQL